VTAKKAPPPKKKNTLMSKLDSDSDDDFKPNLPSKKASPNKPVAAPVKKPKPVKKPEPPKPQISMQKKSLEIVAEADETRDSNRQSNFDDPVLQTQRTTVHELQKKIDFNAFVGKTRPVKTPKAQDKVGLLGNEEEKKTEYIQSVRTNQLSTTAYMNVEAQTSKPNLKKRRTKAKKTISFDNEEDDDKIATAPRPMFKNSKFSITKPKPAPVTTNNDVEVPDFLKGESIIDDPVRDPSFPAQR